MINPRRNFLILFFGSLEASGVRYCMLRNYENVYDGDSATDLDMIVSEYSLSRFEDCLLEAALKAGFRFVHTARYVNYSHVFWHPGSSFVRVDFETDVRWWLFTVLEAREVLDARLRHQEFYIPHPVHESVILYVAAIWRGELSQRYRRQLGVLYAASDDKRFLQKSLIGAFGRAGHVLARMQAGSNEVFDRRFCNWLRFSLVFRPQLMSQRRFKVFKNFWIDARRYIDRIFDCAGVSLVFVSSNPHPSDISELLRKIEFLFPIQKRLVRHLDLRKYPAAPNRVGWWRGWQRLRTLYKGGLFVSAYRVAQDRDWGAALRPHAREMYAERSFVCVEDRHGEFYFAHVKSGIMNDRAMPANAEPPKDFNQLFIEFISNVFERTRRSKRHTSQRPGKFCVLVGLDGAGKTTLARNLAGLGGQEGALAGVRYFHWVPSWRQSFACPLPEPGNQPRKSGVHAGVVQAVLSIARLVRNLIRAQLAWWWRLRPMRNRGYLVLVDRYFYNYYLDPVSVRYYGPRWMLDRLSRWFPKPEIVITLSAPPAVLRQRKQELSEVEILQQAAALRQLKFPTPHVIAADGSEPADVVASKVMAELRKLMS